MRKKIPNLEINKLEPLSLQVVTGRDTDLQSAQTSQQSDLHLTDIMKAEKTWLILN